MKKALLFVVSLFLIQFADAQLVEPEYIGQAYAMLQNGERIALQSEIGSVLTRTNATTFAASHRNIWNVFLPILSANGFSVSQSYGKSENFLNVPSEASLTKLRIKEPFSIVLRLESNEYLPETQIKIVRFAMDKGARYAHSGFGVPFQAVKVGKSSYQITLNKPFYGEYGVVFENDMNTILTFSLGYSDDDVRDYVKPFFESGSVEMFRFNVDNAYDIFDVDTGEYVTEREFADKYGADFLKRVKVEHRLQQKALAKAKKAQRKARQKH